MARSSDSFSSALSHALERLGKPTLTLKEEQRKSIEAVYKGSSVFVWLPTGFGKSICYQALPFVIEHKKGQRGSCAVLVVSPLVSLMIDQVESLRARGVKASIITSGSDIAPSLVATKSALSSDNLLFCTAEALALLKWRDALENETVGKRIVAVVVDEAHCVSKW